MSTRITVTIEQGPDRTEVMRTVDESRHTEDQTLAEAVHTAARMAHIDLPETIPHPTHTLNGPQKKRVRKVLQHPTFDGLTVQGRFERILGAVEG